MTPDRRTAAAALTTLLTVLVAAACGESSPSPSPSPSPSSSIAATQFDLSAIDCATDNPSDVGDLTGAWQGDDEGVYYIRHVGDCVWWFGTEIEDIEPGVTGQPGFANVASGRVIGTHIEVEWADVPIGSILNGGGLTLEYEAESDELRVTERRGSGFPFGASVLMRIIPDASPAGSPSTSPSP